ncbi:hypothetical protein F5883DRAFT_572669 [Diaporthe sp. PMI_573]|nr:hypothetical protein F5883DRAFT_572669 [Diaporthaceae sp. PMI_573]
MKREILIRATQSVILIGVLWLLIDHQVRQLGGEKTISVTFYRMTIYFAISLIVIACISNLLAVQNALWNTLGRDKTPDNTNIVDAQDMGILKGK